MAILPTESNEESLLLISDNHVKSYESHKRNGAILQSESPTGEVSVLMAAFFLVNCSLGAGLVNYPFAYNQVGGILIATVVQVLLMFVLLTTMIILAYASDIQKSILYQDVLLTLCGKKVQILAALSMVLTCYGICVTMLIIIGDQCERIVAAFASECVWFLDRSWLIFLIGVIFVLPMCYFKKLDFLQSLGAAGAIAMVYVAFVTVYEFLRKVDSTSKEVVIKTKPSSFIDLMTIIPVFAFAYQSHEIVIPVYASMKNRNIPSFFRASLLSLLIAFVIYCATGTSGYLLFGVNVLPDVMQHFDPNEPLVAFATLALAAKMVFTIPPVTFCGRGALDGLWVDWRKYSQEEVLLRERRRRLTITTIWFFSSLTIAILVPDIGIVIQLLGSLASVNVFVFPSICLFSLTKQKIRGKPLKIVSNIYAAFLLLFGTLTFVLVLIQTYLNLQKDSKNSLSSSLFCS